MQNWEYKKLGEIYNFIDYRGMTPNKIDEGIPLITAKNVRMGYIDYSIKDFISEEDYKKRQTRGVAHKGDILFTTEAPLGYSALADLEVFSTGQRIITFQQFDNEQSLYNPFYNYYFQSSEFQKLIKENATGLTATGIKASRLREIPIPLPSLEEQKRIVKILDEKFAMLETVKANAKANLQNAKDLFQSQLTKAFSNTTWEKKRLFETVVPECTLGYGIVQPGDDVENGVPVVRPVDLTTKYISKPGLKKVLPEISKAYSRTVLRGGELLICVRGTTGVVSIASEDLKDCNVTRGISPLRFKENVTALFMYYCFQTKEISNVVQEKTKGAALKQINIGDLRELIVPLPPLPEQKRIVEQLDSLSQKVRSLEEIYTKQLANCDELKQAFLAKAFAGEL